MSPRSLLLFASTLALSLLPALAGAQTPTELEIGREVVQAQRKAIVAQSLELSEEQAKRFWPVYNDYQAKRQEIYDRRVALIKQYSGSYETLTDEQAMQLVNGYQAFNKDRHELRRDFVEAFSKVLPPKRVMRFYQVENKLDAIIDYRLAQSVPLPQVAEGPPAE